MKPVTIFRIYWLVVMSELALIYLQLPEWRWFTKPLLMPLLGWAFLQGTGIADKPFRAIILAALFFSWGGDLLLQLKGFFIPGLISFLTAHIFYIAYFLKAGKGKKGLLQYQPLIGVPVLAYLLIFLMLLYPFLDTMKIPVTVYGITICTMLFLSINMRRNLSDNSATLFFNGALQFVLSDSILAVNLFAFPNMILSLCVMLTYTSAQYLMVKASLTHLRED